MGSPASRESSEKEDRERQQNFESVDWLRRLVPGLRSQVYFGMFFVDDEIIYFYF